MEFLLPLLAAGTGPLEAARMPDLWAIAPELFLGLMVLVHLTIDLVRNEGGGRIHPLLSTVGVVVAGALVLLGGEPVAAIGYDDFPNMTNDALSRIFKLIFLVTGLLTVAFLERSRAKWAEEAEFHVLLFGALAGMCYLASATDVVSFYLAFETVSYTGFLLAGYQLDSPKSAEASGKFVIFGSVSSAVMLFGITIVYGITGSLRFDEIAAVLAVTEVQPVLVVAAIMIFGGFAFKAAAFPFQFWCPDVYEGSPTPVAAFLAVASKAAVFAVGLRVLSYGTGVDPTAMESLGSLLNLDGASVVQNVLIVSAAATMTWGNLAALRQTNLQRMLAYSSIGHAGYLLMTSAVIGFGSTDDAGSRALSAVLFYFVIYLFMTLGAFFIVTLMKRDTGSVELDALKGQGWRRPLLGACFAVMLFSLTGLPPTAGFVGKFQLFAPVIEQGLYTLAIVGLINGAISLYYYARPLRLMYFQEPDEGGAELKPESADLALLATLTLPLIVFGLFGWDTIAGFASSAAEEALRTAQGVLR